MSSHVKKLLVLPLTLFFTAMPYALTAGATPADAGTGTPTLAPMLKQVVPGVVSIAVKGHMPAEENPLFSDPFFRHFFGVPDESQSQAREFQAVGSGVIVDSKQGFIITNDHVIDKAKEITVTLSDERHLKATKIGADAATDIALIQVHAEGLKSVPLGDSDKLEVGDYVVAIGNPFGLQQTVTSGVVSALGRTGLGIEAYESFIQTDASINPGNSGGALVNLHGELVGINTAIAGPSGGNVGIGFAIPINMARQVVEQLAAYGKVRRGQLGVGIQDLTPELAKALKTDAKQGAVIASVTPGSAASAAGLQTGDIVTAVNGEKVRNAADLRNKIGLQTSDQRLELGIIHQGRGRTVAATLREPKTDKLQVPAKVSALADAVLGSIEPGSPLYGRVEGAVVLELKEGSKAAEAGLVPGDVIVAVDQQQVHSPKDVVKVAESNHGTLLLQVVRNDTTVFLVIG